MIQIFHYGRNPYSETDTPSDFKLAYAFNQEDIEKGLKIPTTFVSKILVTGETIEYIRRSFVNIPFPLNWNEEEGITFHGDLAKFIVSNL